MEKQFSIRGTVEMSAIDNDGNVLWTEKKDNLVVTLGRRQICHLMAGDTTGRFVTQIGFGTGSVAPVVGDTTLTTLFKKAIGAASYPADGFVTFQWTLLNSEYNGNTINEMAIFSGDNTMISRLLKGPIVKNNTFGLVGSWTFQF